MSKKEKGMDEIIKEAKKHAFKLKAEKFECPHCGKEIEIETAVRVKSTKVE